MDPLEDGSVSLDFSEVSTPVCLKSGILNLQLGVLLLQVLGLLPLGIQLKKGKYESTWDVGLLKILKVSVKTLT